MTIANTQKIEPFLWFDTQAEEAVNHYVSIFGNSRIRSVQRYGKEGPGEEGSVMTIAFELDGLRFSAINGGPHFKFTEAVSFVISCADQTEVDYYWEALLRDGGKPQMCGWLKDKFGLSWQVVPQIFFELLDSADAAGKSRMMQAMMKMVKFDIASLEAAFKGD